VSEDINKRVLIFTGEGKGKTTAALGMSLRASGHGQKVCIIHFVKSRKDTGEVKALAGISGIDQHITGLGFLPDPDSDAFQRHLHAAGEGLRLAREILNSCRYDLVVLDEICWAVHKSLIQETEVIDLLNCMKDHSSIVFTGRFAPQSLIDAADTVTEMTKVKHAYDEGIPAQPGIEK